MCCTAREYPGAVLLHTGSLYSARSTTLNGALYTEGVSAPILMYIRSEDKYQPYFNLYLPLNTILGVRTFTCKSIGCHGLDQLFKLRIRPCCIHELIVVGYIR